MLAALKTYTGVNNLTVESEKKFLRFPVDIVSTNEFRGSFVILLRNINFLQDLLLF